MVLIEKKVFIINTGGGRKIKDPIMERKLFDWYLNYHEKQNKPVTAKMVKKMALEYKTCSDFIASKGWLEKFRKKHHLKLTRENDLLNVKKK